MNDPITWERKIKRPMLSEISRMTLGCQTGDDIEVVRAKYGFESEEFQGLLSKQYSQMEYLEASYGLRKKPPEPTHESWGAFT